MMAGCNRQAEDQERQFGEEITPEEAATPRFTLNADHASGVSPTDTLRGEQCSAGQRVEVSVEIAGGTKGNSVHGAAYCGDVQVVQTVIAIGAGTDSIATGVGDGQQATGRGGCTGAPVLASPPTESRWKVTCTFY